MGGDFLLINVNKLLQGMHQFIEIDLINELEIDFKDCFETGSQEVYCYLVFKKMMQCNSRLNPNRQIRMIQVLIGCIKHMSEMLLILEGEVTELAVEPGGTGAQHGVGGGELGEDKGLEQGLDGLLEFDRTGDVLFQVTEGMHNSFLNSEIFLGCFQILS